MLTKEGCLFRQKRLWDAVPSHVDWLLVADPRHVQYLVNFLVQPLSFSGGERALLLLEREQGATLLGDNFALRAGSSEHYADREVAETWYDHKHSVQNRDHVLFAALRHVAPRIRGMVGLLEAEWLPLGAIECLDRGTGTYVIARDDAPDAASDLGSVLRGLRRQKQPDEIALIRESVKAGEAGLARLREIVRPGISETEIYMEVQKAALSAIGRPGLVYGDFRATSPEKPKVGGLPTDHRLQDGELFILDYSVVLNGYRADFTNTLAVGKPSDGAKELFALCQAGMAAGEGVLKAGAKASDVHAAVASPYVAAGRQAAFTHHAGHGVGLAHPEPPILVPESTDVLVAGDVITLEPGAYIEGVAGMRIERNYLITESGADCLTRHEISLT
ncbi:MAG: aminopeptidase P family protein [Planctomyces sp.]|nr:aminopeptidase P family protein [Planctomyces sp.]